MKIKLILLACLGIITYVVIMASSAGVGRSGYERTGASGTAGCGSCHGSSATASTTITIQLLSGGSPVTSYTGGSSYTIVITGTNTSSSYTLPYFGFQVSAVNSGTTTNAGTLSAITGTALRTVSGINLVEQSAAMAATTGTGGSGTTYVLNIPWTAPVAGTGSVTIYTVLNAVNHNGTDDAGDKWNYTNLVVPEAVSVLPITGTLSACIGATTPLADASTGGTWSSSATGVATVSSTGVVTGVAAGTATISYTATAGTATAVVTVNPMPAAIGGTLTVCAGGTVTLADATSGGTWSGGTSGIASITSGGSVTGVASGTAPVTYTLPTGCFAQGTVTVNTLPAITGLSSVCAGHTITEANTATGGTWTSGATSIGTITSSTGVFTGVSAGTCPITYTLASGCYVTATIIVNVAPPGTISGSAVACIGGTTNLSASLTGGTWSASNGHATISAAGVVTGVSMGYDTIRYVVTNSCGTGTATHIMSVLPNSNCHTGVQTIAMPAGLTIYPNPASAGDFTISLATPESEDMRILITSIAGAYVKQLSGTTNTPLAAHLDCAPGIYLVHIATAAGRYIGRVVIQ